MSHWTELTVTDLSGTVRIYEQRQEKSMVRKKALVIPAHLQQLNPALQRIEYVLVEPGAEIGERRQRTDKISLICHGAGVLCSNGVEEDVAGGDLAIAPCGTWYTLRNPSPTDSLDVLVVEVETPQASPQPPITLPLFQHLQASEEVGVVYVGRHPMLHRVAVVDLARYCTGPWGQASLVEVPAGGRIEPYAPAYEENLFLLSGSMTVVAGEERFDSAGAGLNVFLPRQLPRAIANRSSVNPLLFFSIQFPEIQKGGRGGCVPGSSVAPAQRAVSDRRSRGPLLRRGRTSCSWRTMRRPSTNWRTCSAEMGEEYRR